MGMQFLIETRIIMKFLVVLALAAIACAEPEAEAKADPAYWYGNYWGGRPAYHGNWGYQSYASPYWGGYYNRGYGYWKRDANAQPDAKADSAFLYRTYFNSPYYMQHKWGLDMSQHQAGINRQMDMNNRQMDMNNMQVVMNNQHTMMGRNMNQMHQVNNMNQMYQVNNMNQMHQVNNMNQMHQVNSMNQVYQMNKAYTYAVPWAYNYGYQQAPRFFKREAEAEADPDYWYGNVYNRFGSRWGYSGFYNRPYGYNLGYNGYRRYGGYWW